MFHNHPGARMSGNRATSVAVVSFVAVLTTLALRAPGAGADAPLRLERGQRIALLVSDHLPRRGTLAVDDLRTYLARSLGAVVRTYPADKKIDSYDAIEEPVCILVGTPGDNAGIAELASLRKLRLDGLGAEGAAILALQSGKKLVVALAGETIAGATHAVYSFLETELGIGFFIDGDRIPALAAVDLRSVDRIEKPSVPIRSLFYHYIWKHPHANNWRLWSWERWQSTIDWMRRKRFNVLPLFHDEGGYLWGDVIFKAFPEIKKNEKSLDQFVVDPTWRSELNHKLVRHARDSGIQIAYNLFYSQVPEFFADYHPELRYHALNMRNLGISALQPECRR